MKKTSIAFIFFGYISLLAIGTFMGILLMIAFGIKIVSAEDLTTNNLTPSMEGMTATGGTSYGTGSGCQQGKYCTSGTQGGGGTYTSSFDVPLTEKEVQQGFTLNSGVTVNSHVSNSYLNTCTSTMQSGDCRDLFKLTITLLDDGITVETFTHEEELTWSGLKDFSYSNAVAENSYGVLTGNYSLWGIDAGYPHGFYGPQFSDPSLTIDYQTAMIQNNDIEVVIQTDTAIQDTIINLADVANNVTTGSPSTPATAPPPNVPTVNMASTTSTAGNSTEAAGTPVINTPSAPPTPQAPTVQTNATASSSQTENQTEAEAEAEITAEANTETEVTVQASNESENTTENTTESNEETPAPSANSSSSSANVAPKSSSGPKAPAKGSKDGKTKTRITPAQAAQTVVARIAPSQRYGANAQTVTMVAMGMIAETGGLLKAKGLPDAVKFWDAKGVPDGPSLVDPSQSYVFFGTSNGAHDTLVESQWRK
tara:strand:+ start:1724 stop:3169 length:1446 start_codon:yes stop_codon:yes gene_type:complete